MKRISATLSHVMFMSGLLVGTDVQAYSTINHHSSLSSIRTDHIIRSRREPFCLERAVNHQHLFTRSRIFSSTLLAEPKTTRQQQPPREQQQQQEQPAQVDKSTTLNKDGLMPMPNGVTVALVTPFKDDYSIDFESYKKMLQMHLDSGTNGLCVLGTTAEAAVMSMEERASILEVTRDMCKGKIPMIVGCGTIDPNHVKEQILQAKEYGADAAMVVTPYYVKPPQRGLIKHFCDAADLGLPLVLYNVPGRTGCDCKPETLAECANIHPNMVAFKEATGDISRVKQIKSLLSEEAKERVKLYSGDDSTTLDFIKEGGDGCISVTANIVPLPWQRTVNELIKGNVETSDTLGSSLNSLHSTIFCESNPIGAKWAMKRLGIIPNDICRPPLASLDPQYYSLIEGSLIEAKMI